MHGAVLPGFDLDGRFEPLPLCARVVVEVADVALLPAWRVGEGRLGETFRLDAGHVVGFADEAFGGVVEPQVGSVGVLDGVEGGPELDLFTIPPVEGRKVIWNVWVI